MLRKTILVSMISLLIGLLSVYAAVEGKPFTITSSMIEEFLLAPYSILDDAGSGEKKVIIKKKRLRSYTGSPTGLVKYGSIISVANSAAGIDPSTSDATSFQAISGIPVFTKTANNDTVSLSASFSNSFSYVNPDFVQWVFRYCVPDPSMKVAGVSCREIYHVVFSRLFRMLAEARLELARDGLYEKEIKAYAEAMKGSDFMGVFYLEEKFAGRLPEYLCKDTNVPPPYQPHMAIGFWLRRGIDGSSDEIWKGLARFMARYDEEWFASKTKKGR